MAHLLAAQRQNSPKRKFRIWCRHNYFKLFIKRQQHRNPVTLIRKGFAHDVSSPHP